MRVSFSRSSYSRTLHLSSSLTLVSSDSHLLLEVLLLVFKGLLYLVHDSPLFEEPSGGRDHVQLHVLGKHDLLLIGVLGVSSGIASLHFRLY